MVMPASDLADARRIEAIAGSLPNEMWCATPVGVHPWAVSEELLASDGSGDLDAGCASEMIELVTGATSSRSAWIGEIGLDYCDGCPADREVQRRAFRAQLRLAFTHGWRVYLHCRDAFDDFVADLSDEAKAAGVPISGILHCFTGSSTQAAALVDLGLHIVHEAKSDTSIATCNG